jgi:hypothetical protein
LSLISQAGCGKTEIALHIADKLRGHIQCGATTGKAASLLHGVTLHGMFGWSIHEFNDCSMMSQRKISDMRSFYQDTETFLIDEVSSTFCHFKFCSSSDFMEKISTILCQYFPSAIYSDVV